MGAKHRDVNNFTGPCSLGVQLCGALFGTILSYMASILVSRKNRSVILLLLAVGVTFGILGSQVASPLDMRAIDFFASLCASFGIAMLLCWSLDTDISSLFNIVLVSLLTSVAVSSLHSVAVLTALLRGYARQEAVGDRGGLVGPKADGAEV